MAGNIKLQPGSRTSLLTTELNSLATANGSAQSATVNQDTDLNLEALLELNVTFGSAPTAESVIEVYMQAAPDGTNFTTYASGATPYGNAHDLVATFVLRASTAAQRLRSNTFRLPGCDVKFAVISRAGTSFPASGSTMHILPWMEQYT